MIDLLLQKGLRDNSPYYPEILQRESRMYQYRIPTFLVTFSTLVRIERENKWYNVHVVEKVMVREDIEIISQTIKRLLASVHNIIHCYGLWGMEELDSLQIPEQERLGLIYDKKITPFTKVIQ